MPGVFDPPLRPTPYDGLRSETWLEQLETETSIASLLPPLSPLALAAPVLHRETHARWLANFLLRGLQRAEGYDTSQPWLVYWVLQSLVQLGFLVDRTTADKLSPFPPPALGAEKRSDRELLGRCVATVMRSQHPTGGFGGGPHQMPHLLPTYAAVCALAIAGHAGPGGGWDEIDREGMYRFFMSLKQEDGSFIVCEDGEVDMRGFYCLLTVATLLDILTPELVSGLASYIAKCQTYEGGFSSAGFAFAPPSGGGHASLGEAHGGYTFCALASLFLLRPLTPTALTQIDAPRLVRWAASMQGAGVEGGGFRGRTNKLVDACYAWWVGGMEPMLQELVRDDNEGEGEWQDWDDSVLDTDAVQHYILLVSQSPTGGLRDKPGKQPDTYHTNSALSGLATAQHRVAPSPETRRVMLEGWREGGVGDAEEVVGGEWRKEAYLASCEWTEDEGADTYVGGEQNRVNAVHPIYDLMITHVRGMMGHFYGQEAVRSFVEKEKEKEKEK